MRKEQKKNWGKKLIVSFLMTTKFLCCCPLYRLPVVGKKCSVSCLAAMKRRSLDDPFELDRKKKDRLQTEYRARQGGKAINKTNQERHISFVRVSGNRQNLSPIGTAGK